MSPTERGLWDAVLANADDDLARLVYADYLEENGRAPLANFIRAQITLSQCPPGHPNYADAVEAQSLAVAAARGASSLPAPTLPEGATFAGSVREVEGDGYGAYERGFASRVTFSGLRMRTGPGKLAHALWRVVGETAIRDLDLVHVPDSDLAELLACPACAQLVGTGHASAASDPALYPRRLAEAAHLGGVRRLALGEAAARASRFPARPLDEWGNPVGEPQARAEWEAVAAAPWVAGVTAFAFADWWLYDRFRDTMGPAVTSLSVRGTREYFTRRASNRGFDDLRGLRQLEVSGATLYDGTLRLARLVLPNLRALHLSKLGSLHHGADTALDAPCLDGLVELAITGAQADPIPLLAAAEKLRHSLRLVYLDQSIPDGDTLAALAQPSFFPALTTLSVKRHSAPNDGGLARFAEAWRGETLHTLILDGWPAPAAALQKLAANPAFRSLRRLKLSRCGVSDAGGVALARSPHLQQLVELDLSYNTLGEKSAALFLDNGVMPNLVLADLTTNRMHPDTRTRLRASRVGVWA